MKKITLFFGLVLMGCASLFAQAPANCPDVMLQGFHWDSYGGGQMDKSYGRTKWSDLSTQVNDIAGTFTMIWLPPSAKSSGGTGYHPKEWSNQNSDWGSKAQLKDLIKAFKAKGTRCIADIVINHRDGNYNWTDFCNENFGTYGSFTLYPSAQFICKDDECTKNGHSATGNKDAGYDYVCEASGGYCASRDLDHSNTTIQNAIKAYVKWMKNEMGYDGWRYDLVKGYLGKYTKMYNQAGGAYYSVGEYWDGNYDAVKNWVNETGKTSTAFDFPNKYATFNEGLAKNNYGAMVNGYKVPNGLCGADEMKRYATTFIDNHDTFRDGSKYGGDWTKANAVLLAQPGIPCVFYPHWEKCKADIKKMVATRRQMGIHSQSACTTAGGGSYYQSTTTGTKGTLICFVGSGWSDPSGYSKVCGGNGWAYYTNKPVDFSNTGNNPIIPDVPVTKTDITIKVKAPSSWTQCYLWAWDSSDNNLTNAGEWPGTTAMTKNADGTFSYTVKNVPGTLNFLFNDGKSGGEQTADESTTSNSCWTIGSKNASNENKYDLSQNSSCDLAPSPKPNPNPNPNPNPTPNPDGSITLRVKASSIPWGDKCYIYTWDGGELGAEVKYSGEWPGSAMTLDSNGYYTYTLKQSMVYAIFTDGSGSGTLQTDDIQSITASTCFEISSEQHENMLGAMVYDAIVTDCPAQTAIIEAEAVELSIYPNPTNDYININCTEEISEVVISALNGSEVIRTKSNEIDLSPLSPSIYFVNIMLQNGDVVRSKVIRK